MEKNNFSYAKRNVKIMIGVLVILFLICLNLYGVYALEKQYTPSEKKITILDSSSKKEKVSAELIYNTDACVECEAIIKITTKENINNLIDGINFKKVSKKEKEQWDDANANIKNFKFQTGQKVIQTMSYIDVYTNQIITQTIEYYNWTEKNKGDVNNEFNKKGDYYLRISGTKAANENIDWVLSILGIELDEWTVWGLTYVYDEINDSFINQTLWSNSTGGIGSYTGETPGYLYAGGSVSGFGSMSSSVVTTAAFPPTGVKNITMRVSVSANDANPGGAGGATVYNRAHFYIGGTLIKQVVYNTDPIGTSSLSDDSIYTFIKNGSLWNVYDDGVFLMNINNVNSIQVSGEMGALWTAGSYSSNIYYVYYSIDEMTITLNSPANNTYYLNGAPTILNASTLVLVNSLQNITFYVDDILNGTYIVSGLSNSTTHTNTFPVGSHTWNVIACDNESNCKTSENKTFIVTYFNTLNTTFNATVYETDTQSFNALTEIDSLYPDSYAYFVYNGVQQSLATKTVEGINVTFNYTMDIPASTGVKSFYFKVFLDAFTPANTTLTNQTVNAISLAFCTSGTKFINMNYLDEISGTAVNLSVPSSSWIYWLGSGSTYKSYSFSTTTENTTHAFCFTPAHETVYTSINYQYGVSGTYPIRTYQTSTLTPAYLTLTNNTLEQNLYTISATESAPITLQVSDASSANVIQNAIVTITRDINGVPTQIFTGLTDSAGTVNVWLSTVTPYTITTSKAGCGSNTVTITPVGSYNIQLNCAGNLTEYVSQIDGVTYQRTPAEGVSTQAGLIEYGYYVQSTINPITAAKFLLVDGDGTIVATNETNVSSGYSFCTNSSCLLSLKYTVAFGDTIKGRYYVNLGNTTNFTYVLLEGDAMWKYVGINTNNSQNSFNKFFDHFNQFFFQWSAGGQTGISCAVYNTPLNCNAVSYCKWLNYTGNQESVNKCILKDDYNKAEFSRVLLIFFGMVVVLFIIGKSTGYEMSNPGSFIMFLTGAIIIMSFGGMFRFSGAVSFGGIASPFFDQWIYAIICTAVSIGYNISIVRRYSA